MPFSPTTIPQISISPAPPQEPTAEPYSPFASINYPDNDDTFRSRLLTPPPSSPFRSTSSRSPDSLGYNSDEERFDYNEGLDHHRFEALLRATRERNAKKDPDLRREVALKAHKTKQFERRTRFVTRILAGSLNTAANSLAPPSVPLSSPKVAQRFVKPNPLALLHDKEDEDINPSATKGNSMPSLEEIRARLISKQRTAGAFHIDSSSGLPADSTGLKAPQPRLPQRVLQRLGPSTEHVDQTRATRAADMLCALKRRTSPPTDADNPEEKKRKRHSAPGDLFPSQEREGFEHPVLSVPGGF